MGLECGDVGCAEFADGNQAVQAFHLIKGEPVLGLVQLDQLKIMLLAFFLNPDSDGEIIGIFEFLVNGNEVNNPDAVKRRDEFFGCFCLFLASGRLVFKFFGHLKDEFAFLRANRQRLVVINYAGYSCQRNTNLISNFL